VSRKGRRGRTKGTRWAVRSYLILVLIVGLILGNGLAYMQARSFCRFVEGGQRTARPEHLAGWARIAVLLTGVRVTRPPVVRSPAEAGLPYASFNLPEGSTPLLTGWRIPASHARATVLLFHGYAASRDQVLDAAALFHRLGYEAVLMDFRACGTSRGDETGLGYTEADDVARLAGAMPAGQPLILFGESMGAAAILRAVAHRGLSPSAIILEAPFDRLSHAVVHRFELMRVPPYPAAWLLLGWGGVREGFNALAFAPRVDAQAVRCPLLVLRGSLDPTVTHDEALRVVNASSGVHRYVEFPGVGHEPLAQHHAREWLAAVGPFLHSLPAPTGGAR